MQFSTRAEYGLRAIVSLAKIYPEQKNLQEISREEKISMKYLERLFVVLKKGKLIKSTKGKYGGYTLAKSPKVMNTGEIIELLEGTIAPMKCVETKCYAHCGCASKAVWMKLGAQIHKTLYAIKLADLI